MMILAPCLAALTTLAAPLVAHTCAGSAPQNPLAPTAKTANPLAKAAPAQADPWVQRFTGKDIGLALQVGGAANTYTGTLTFGASQFPAEAAPKADGSGLAGTFRVDQDSFVFECTLNKNELTLTSGGATYTLLASGAPQQTPPPPPLTQIATGPTTTWTHPEGYFTCALPRGWTVAEVTDEAVLLNPGLTETLDAIILVSYGELDPADQGRDVRELLDSQEPELRRALTAEDIRLAPPKQKSRKFLVSDLPGAEQTWTGTAGPSKVTAWFGGLVIREYYLAVTAIIVDGKRDQFLPGAKQVFQSMQPKPPQRNRKLERALVDQKFISVNTTSSGSLSVSYRFRGDGSVVKFQSFSGTANYGDVSVGTSSEDYGTYQVVGNRVFMAFPNGQESAKVGAEGNDISYISFGTAKYRRG